MRQVRDTVLLDIRTCELTLAEVMQQVKQWVAEFPGDEIFMDGDAYAIVRRQVVA